MYGPVGIYLMDMRLSVADLKARRSDLHAARHAHVRAHMEQADVAAMLLVDPNDIVYATGARNMTLFTARIPKRYLLMFSDGYTII